MRAALLVLAAVLALAGCGSSKPESAAPPATSTVQGGLLGLRPETLPRKPHLVLTDTSGRRYALAAATRGKLTYLYFGYTHCPDACPLTMSTIAAAIRDQPASVRRRIAVVFVTVDPKRDTGPVLRRWLDGYNRSFVGLRGGGGAVAAAEAAAGVPRAPGGVLNHSTLVLAYSPDGLSHVVYSQGFSARDYAHDMPLLLRYGSG